MAEKIGRQEKNFLVDSHGRIINYLRLSVTDRCNLRCLYCHPPYKIECLERSKICSYGELFQIVKAASKIGIDKIRLTGGELFLRKDITEFIHSLQEIKEIKEIVLTTNGTLLLPHLKRLKEIGLKRINLSLDTLSEDMYLQITGGNGLSPVLEGIHKALEEGFKIKINMVVLKGVNEAEIPGFIRNFLKYAIEVRFIEFMPLCGHRWREDYFFPYDKILEIIRSQFDIYPLAFSGVTQEFAVNDRNGLAGKIGVIAPITRSFCTSCSRLRLSANGELRPCLFLGEKVELLPLLRGSYSRKEKEDKIKMAFRKAVMLKPYCVAKNHVNPEVYIRSLGG